jgi:hypothetical protein
VGRGKPCHGICIEEASRGGSLGEFDKLIPPVCEGPQKFWVLLLYTNHRQTKKLKTVTVFFSFAHRLKCIFGEKK